MNSIQPIVTVGTVAVVVLLRVLVLRLVPVRVTMGGRFH